MQGKEEKINNKRIKTLEKLEKAFRNYFWFMCVGVLLLPMALMSLLAFIVKWGSTIINTNEIIIEFKTIAVGDYIYWYGSYLMIIVTAIFSYVLWKSSERSNKLAEEIKNREDNRDNEIIRENALIVYFDIFMGLDDLRKLYSYHVLVDKKHYLNAPQKLFFSKEWIKNVAILKDKLSTSDIKTIYNLYGKLLTIKGLLDDKVDIKELSEVVKGLFLEIFEDRVPGVVNEFELKDIRKILKVEYVILLDTIEVLTSTNIDKNCVDGKVFLSNQYYQGTLKNGEIQGVGKYFIEKGTVIFEGEFKNNKFVSGTRYVWNEKNQLLYQCQVKDGRFDLEEEVILYEDGKKIYKGTLKDGDYLDGEGKKYLADYNSNDNLKKFLYPIGNYKDIVFIYDGQFKSGQYNGMGKIFYIENHYDSAKKQYSKTQNTLCEGEFQNNYLINGNGKIIKRSHGIFEGTWIKGEIQSGIYKSFDGIYIIENITRLNFKEEVTMSDSDKACLGFISFKGDGIITYKGIISHKGEMIGLDLTGRGIEYFTNNKHQIKYEGYFDKFDYNGKGTEYYDNVNHSIKFKGIFERGQYKGGKQYDEKGNLLYSGDFKENKIANGYVYRNAGFKVTPYVKGYSLEECVCEGEIEDFHPKSGCLVIDQNNEEIGNLKKLDNNTYELIHN